MGGADAKQSVDSRIALLLGEAEQQVFRRDVLILEVGGFGESLLHGLGKPAGEARLALRAGDAGKLLFNLAEVRFEALCRHADFFENGQDDALAVRDQRKQEVHGLQFGVPEFRRLADRLLHRFLRFHCQFIPTYCHKIAAFDP